jgi:hypothetical protein
MVNNVEISGGGPELNGAILRNAATEETLQQLVKVLSKTGGSGTASKVNDLFERSIKNNIRAVDTSTTKTNAYNKTLDDLNARSKEFRDTLKNIGGIGVGLLFNGIVSAGRGLIGLITSSQEAYMNAADVGATFGNNLIELRRAAAEASLPLDALAESLRNNSTMLVAFGGTVSQGARRFSELSKNLREGELGQQLMGMGFTMVGLNESLGNYLNLQSRLGNISRRSNQELVEGAREYLYELDRMARITGMSRRQQEESFQRQAADAVLANIQGEIASNAQQLARARSNVALLERVGLLDAAKDVLGFVTSTQNAFLQQSGITRDVLLSFVRGERNVSDFIDVLQQANPQFRQLIGATEQQRTAMLQRDPQLQAMYNAFREIARMSGQTFQSAQDEQAARHSVTEALNSFAQVFQSIKDRVLLAFLNSGVFTRLETQAQNIASIFLRYVNELTPKLTQLLTGFDSFLEGFLSTASTQGFGTAIMETIRLFIARLLGGGPSTEQQQTLDRNESRLREIRNQQSEIEQQRRTGFQNVPESERDDLSMTLDRDYQRLTQERNDLLAETGNINQNIIDAMPSLSQFLGIDWDRIKRGITGVAVALGVGAGLGLALLAFAPGAPVMLAVGALVTAVGIGVGVAGAGLGYMFSQLTPLIEGATTSFARLPGVLNDFASIDSNKLGAVGEAFQRMTAPLLAAGVASVLEALTGASGITNLTRDLNRIDDGKLQSVAGAMVSLFNSMRGFTREVGVGFQQFANGVANIPNNTFERMDGLGRALQSFQVLDTDKIVNFLSSVFTDAIGDNVNGFILKTNTAISRIPANIEQNLTALSAGLNSFSVLNVETISRVFSQVFSEQNAQSFSTFMERIGSRNIAAGSFAVVADGLSKFNDIRVENINGLVQAFSNLRGQVSEPIPDVMSGFIANLAQSLRSLGNIRDVQVITSGFAALIQGLTRSIPDNFQERIQNLSSGLNIFSGINTENLTQVFSQVFSEQNATSFITFMERIGSRNIAAGSLAVVADGLSKFNDINSENLNRLVQGFSALRTELTQPIPDTISQFITNLSQSMRFVTQVINPRAISAGFNAFISGVTRNIPDNFQARMQILTDGLSGFSSINVDSISRLFGNIFTNQNADNFKYFIEQLNGNFNQDSFAAIANSLTKFNDINSDNFVGVVDGFKSLRNELSQNLSQNITDVDNFASSIRTLTDDIKSLNSELSALTGENQNILGGTGIGGLTSGIRTTGTTALIEEQKKLNALIESIKPVLEDTRDNTKNTSDAISRRNQVI